MPNPSDQPSAPVLAILGQGRYLPAVIAGLGRALGARAPDDEAEVVRLQGQALDALGRTEDDSRPLGDATAAAAPPQWARALGAGEGKAPMILALRRAGLFSLWQPAFATAGLRPAVCIAVEDPGAFARACLAEQELPEPAAWLLWLRLALEAVAVSGETPRVFVTDAQLRTDWRGVMARLAGRLDLAWPQPVPAAGGTPADGLLARLAPPAPADQTGPPRLVVRAHQALRALADADGPEPEEALAVLADIAARLDETAALFPSWRSRTREAGLAASRQQVVSLARANTALHRALERERHSVVQPLLRRGLALLRATARGLPQPVRVSLREAFYGAVTLVHRDGALARQYRAFKTHDGLLQHREATAASDEAGGMAPADILQAARTAQTVRGDRFDVVVFPIIDWHFRTQRPQHLAMQLGRRGHRVFYLSTSFATAGREPGFTLHDMPAENVFLCRLSCPEPRPAISHLRLRGEQRVWLAAAVGALRRTLDLGPMVSLVQFPFWRPVVEAIPDNLVVYDRIDHYAGFSQVADTVVEEEKRLIARADLVVATATWLADGIGADKPVALIRNAAEVDFFAAPPEAPPRAAAVRPVVGYYGAIAEWFDLTLVTAAARAFPDWDFVLIGAVTNLDTTAAEALPNIRFLGELPYARLPEHLHGFDVCVIPFVLSELTLSTNPVKIYEYLSAGKPVVATPLPELLPLAALIHIAGSEPAFLDKLRLAMAERFDGALAESRARWARRHDWSERAARLKRAIEDVLFQAAIRRVGS